ncbi:MAG: prolyl oligopeptidase family serine peptidase [Candidatus Acidiferrales bacterium]
MPQLISVPPVSEVEPVTEILHGVVITDPYRWLEEQDSPRTRRWIEEQTEYARNYLDSIPGRERIRTRIEEFLAIETYDSLQKAGTRYFFRKRLPYQEQPCIYMREGFDGEDQLLLDPFRLRSNPYTAVKLLRVSPDAKFLLYEVKEGGERAGTFALLDIATRQTLPDILPHGYLRGFAFAPNGEGFYYVHEALDAERPFYRAVYLHVFGSSFSQDTEIFFAGEDANLRLSLLSDSQYLGIVAYRFLDKTRMDLFLMRLDEEGPLRTIIADAGYRFGPVLTEGRIFAITDREAPNQKIVELRLRENQEPIWQDVVPESGARIQQWVVAKDRLLVSYLQGTNFQVSVFDFAGRLHGTILTRKDETIRLSGISSDRNELFLETESFTEPVRAFRYSANTGQRTMWAKRCVPFAPEEYEHAQVWYWSEDGTRIPMFLVGRKEVLAGGEQPAIMTSYGGYGVPMTPQFSVFVAFLMAQGCLFALPQIRGGSEFGSAWHEAAKRRKRQTAYDDFLSAAVWLIEAGRTTADKLAIFGGSNSGLLVGAAMTQRPDLFRAAVCMVPILDMLRYHLFDGAHIWQEEFGTTEDPEDFKALAAYSPYHQVRDGIQYPAVLIVSGDADRNCNPLHARKMIARLQAANRSSRPILLDYSPFRGHSQVLPLSDRVAALTNRMAFLCDQLGIPV